MRSIHALLAAILLTTFAAPAFAQDVQEEASSWLGADFEIDPLAYALGGASLHGAVHLSNVRVSLGVFALPVPVWLHGNEGLSRDGVGYGAKADYFFGPDTSGFHAGVNLDVSTNDYLEDATSISVTRTEVNVGGRIGWRFQHESGLYVNPWVGVFTPVVGRGDVAVGSSVFQSTALQVFPTIHIGWKMR